MSEDNGNWTGVNPDAPASSPQNNQQATQADYFGFQATARFMLPDKTSWIEFSKMNEGQKKKFQDTTSSDMILERKSGDARMSVKQGTQRHELIKACCVNWNLTRGGEPVPFSLIQLNDFLTLADPDVVEDLEKAIRKANPWLLAEMTSKDIEKEIDNLKEMLEVALKREAGEAS